METNELDEGIRAFADEFITTEYTGEQVENTIQVNLHDPFLERIFKCSICLQPYEKTLAIMGCLHRFCSDCIHHTLRMDQLQKECPLCRIKVSSRRDCRHDENFDSLVGLFHPKLGEFDHKGIVDYTQEGIKYRKLHEQQVRGFRMRQQEILSEKRRIETQLIHTTDHVQPDKVSYVSFSVIPYDRASIQVSPLSNFVVGGAI